MRVILIGQPEQYQMPGMARRESGDFQVVVHELVWPGEWMILAAEELLLVVVARSPCEHGADIQFLALDLAHHVIWLHTFRGILVVRTTRGMYMMVPGIPAIFRRIDPPLHREGNFVWTIWLHVDLLCLRVIFRSHRGSNGVGTSRNEHGRTVFAIDLRLKKKVGRQALCGIRIEPVEA